MGVKGWETDKLKMFGGNRQSKYFCLTYFSKLNRDQIEKKLRQHHKLEALQKIPQKRHHLSVGFDVLFSSELCTAGSTLAYDDKPMRPDTCALLEFTPCLGCDYLWSLLSMELIYSMKCLLYFTGKRIKNDFCFSDKYSSNIRTQ